MTEKVVLDLTVATKLKKRLPKGVWPLLVMVGLVSLATSILGSVLMEQGKDSALSTEEELLPQKLAVLALGRLEPEGEIVNVAGPMSERISYLAIKEGDEVQAGTVIAYLDNYQQLLNQRDLAESKVQEIKEQIATDTRLQQAQIDKAKSQIDSVTTPTLFQADAQKAIVRRLEAEEDNVRLEYSRWQYLQSQGAVSSQELDSKKLAVEKVTEDLKQARQTLDQLISKRQIDISSASTELRLAQINKQRVQTHSGLRSAIASLKLAEADLERTIIRAPKQGKVLKIFTKQGEAIPQTGTILQMGNTKQMVAVAEVYETDISLIKPNQKVTITSPALPKPIQGSVNSIGNLIYKNNLVGDDPAADTDARIVEVKVKLNDENKIASTLSNLKIDAKIHLKSE